MTVRRLLLVALVFVSLAGLSCKWLSRKSYKVDKVSPTGMYRVKVDVNVEDDDYLMGGFHEWGKIELLKGEEVVSCREWNFKDNWETTFIDANPVIQWVGDSVLRMGDDTFDQPLLNDLIISNNSDEFLQHIGVSNGKYEQFYVFDIAPKKQITLRLSPHIKPDGSSNYSTGYGGKTATGKVFDGVMEQKQRKSPVDGSMKYHIDINSNDLRWPGPHPNE